MGRLNWSEAWDEEVGPWRKPGLLHKVKDKHVDVSRVHSGPNAPSMLLLAKQRERGLMVGLGLIGHSHEAVTLGTKQWIDSGEPGTIATFDKTTCRTGGLQIKPGEKQPYESVAVDETLTDPGGNLRSFHQAVRHGGQPYPSLLDGARAVAAVFAAEESARTRRPVTVLALGDDA